MEPDAALEEAVPHPAAAGSDAMDRTLSAKQAKQETAGGQLPTEIAVKFYVTGVGPSYLSPWKVQGQSKWTVRPMLSQSILPAAPHPLPLTSWAICCCRGRASCCRIAAS